MTDVLTTLSELDIPPMLDGETAPLVAGRSWLCKGFYPNGREIDGSFVEQAHIIDALRRDSFRRVTFLNRDDERIGVSTVWLGCNENPWPDTPILIFETMLTYNSGNERFWRYATQSAAEAGHTQIINALDAIGFFATEKAHA